MPRNCLAVQVVTHQRAILEHQRVDHVAGPWRTWGARDCLWSPRSVNAICYCRICRGYIAAGATDQLRDLAHIAFANRLTARGHDDGVKRTCRRLIRPHCHRLRVRIVRRKTGREHLRVLRLQHRHGNRCWRRSRGRRQHSSVVVLDVLRGRQDHLLVVVRGGTVDLVVRVVGQPAPYRRHDQACYDEHAERLEERHRTSLAFQATFHDLPPMSF
ncbi:hypothetical protein FEP62_04408 [Burkholderia multivorans]|nr:hypothetical protein [Burkholderia multivorans]MDR8882516.1 hypothetical protein [Burkholderia multivorans]MDR8913885.1 hypothetical protein [Burkholderia multivorans]MDR8949593.1 hypothetical protein [Burkholderia multivorans]MDR8962255.1 hypothetical protein [Burkholderia multivorans]